MTTIFMHPSEGRYSFSSSGSEGSVLSGRDASFAEAPASLVDALARRELGLMGASVPCHELTGDGLRLWRTFMDLFKVHTGIVYPATGEVSALGMVAGVLCVKRGWRQIQGGETIDGAVGLVKGGLYAVDGAAMAAYRSLSICQTLQPGHAINQATSVLGRVGLLLGGISCFMFCVQSIKALFDNLSLRYTLWDAKTDDDFVSILSEQIRLPEGADVAKATREAAYEFLSSLGEWIGKEPNDILVNNLLDTLTEEEQQQMGEAFLLRPTMEKLKGLIGDEALQKALQEMEEISSSTLEGADSADEMLSMARGELSKHAGMQAMFFTVGAVGVAWLGALSGFYVCGKIALYALAFTFAGLCAGVDGYFLKETWLDQGSISKIDKRVSYANLALAVTVLVLIAAGSVATMGILPASLCLVAGVWWVGMALANVCVLHQKQEAGFSVEELQGLLKRVGSSEVSGRKTAQELALEFWTQLEQQKKTEKTAVA